MANVKQIAQDLAERATQKMVRFPKIWDEKKRMQDCGKTIMMHKNEDGEFDVDAALSSLIEKYGTEEDQSEKKDNKKRKKENEQETEESENKPKQAKAVHITCEANRPVATAIMEIGSIYFKNSDARKGGVFSKAAKALRDCEEEIKNSKDAMKLKGIGKGIAAYIEEYLNTGVITKLEELRAGTA
eukprot:gene2500-4858_t